MGWFRVSALLLFTLFAHQAVAGVRAGAGALAIDPARKEQVRGPETLHPFRLDRAALAAMRHGDPVELPSVGAKLEGRVERVQLRTDGRLAWIAKVETSLGPQSAVIVVGDDAVFGVVPQWQGVALRIATLQGNTWLVEGAAAAPTPAPSVDDFLIPPSAQKAALNRAASAPPTSAAATPTVDVLVLYNDSMLAQFGSQSAVLTRIAYLETISNQAYIDSAANLQIHVVGMEWLDYNLRNDNNVALNDITLPSSLPAKLEVDALRNSYGADLVSLLRTYDAAVQTSGGVAWIGGYHGSVFSADYGFSVVADCAPGSGYYCSGFAFPHELGHNLGSHHDSETANGDYGAYTYSRGYRLTDANLSASFHTIMAYRSGQQAELARFSNPNLSTCQGQPCGIVDAADNARSLSNTAPSVAVFRASGVVPNLRIADVSVTEGDAGSSVATFTVRLGAASGAPVSFDIATANGTASAGSDYQANSALAQTFAPGTTSKTFSVTVNGDTSAEPDETFTVGLSNVSGAVVVGGTATGTIVDDDSGPLVSVADVAVLEGTNQATFTVSLSEPAANDISFKVTLSSGTAVYGDDFNFYGASTLTIPAGQTSKQVVVSILNDNFVEPDETFNFDISNVTGTRRGSKGDLHAVGTILNDDLRYVSVDNQFVWSEGNTGSKTISIVATLSQASDAPVTFDLKTEDLTASAGSDYSALNVVGASFAPGQVSKTFSITIYGDTDIEDSETFRVLPWNITGAVLGNPGYVSIVNDDFAPVVPGLSVSDTSFNETDAGQQYATFNITLEKPYAEPVTFDMVTEPGTASPDVDYVTANVIGVTMLPGNTSVTYSVMVNGDLQVEQDETFTLNLRNVVGAPIAKGAGLATIKNDDTPGLSIADVHVTEAPGGATATFVVQLSRAVSAPVWFDIATTAGSASAGSDFVAKAQTGRLIDAGRSRAVFEVNILDDALSESPETFSVSVANVLGAKLVRGTATATIHDDEAAATPISRVQGSAMLSPLLGTEVEVEGIVTAVVPGGFFLQSPGAGDGDPRTSEGLAVIAAATTVAPGQRVRARGRVEEVRSRRTDPLTRTTLAATTVRVLDPTAALPAPIILRAAQLATNASLEAYEGMRVQTPALRVVGPVGGRIDVANYSARSDGKFHVTVATQARPARVGRGRDSLRLRVDSARQLGASALSADAGDRLAGLVGVLGYQDGLYELLPDARPIAQIASGLAPRPVSGARANEASFGLFALRDLRDSRDTDGAVLEPKAQAVRLAKTANAICAFAKSPDVLAVSGVESPQALADLAAAVNAGDGNLLFPGSCAGDAGYRAVMPAGSSGLGFLVRSGSAALSKRVRVVDLQVLAAATTVPQLSGSQATSREQAPLLLTADLPDSMGRPNVWSLLLVDLREVNPEVAPEQAATRRALRVQAIARLLAQRRLRMPGERLLVMGDVSADELAAQAGTAAAPLVDLLERLPTGERYTAVRDGLAIADDHLLLDPALASAARVDIARINADAGEDHLGDATLPVRISDRDPVIGYFELR